LHVNISTSELEFIKRLNKCSTDLHLLTLVSETTIELLWIEFSHLLSHVPKTVESQNNDEEYSERAERFVMHLRKFSSKIVRVVSIDQLPAHRLSMLDLIVFFEKYHICVERNIITAIQRFSRLEKSLSTILKDYHGLKTLLSLMKEIWSNTPHKKSACLKMWLEEVLFFLYYPRKSKFCESGEKTSLLTQFEVKVYSNPPSSQLEQELSALVKFFGCVNDDLSNKVDDKVKGRLLYSLFSVWQVCIEQLMAVEILNALPAKEIAYKYHPPWSPRRVSQPYHPFEDIYYHMLLRKYMYEIQDNTLLHLIGLWKNNRKGETKASQLLLTIEKFCRLISVFHKATQVIGEANDPGEAVLRLKVDNKEGLKDALKSLADDNIQCYFFQLLDEHTFYALVQDKEALECLGLGNWFVKEGVKKAPYHLLPFMFDESTQNKEYEILRNVMLKGKIFLYSPPHFSKKKERLVLWRKK